MLAVVDMDFGVVPGTAHFVVPSDSSAIGTLLVTQVPLELAGESTH